MRAYAAAAVRNPGSGEGQRVAGGAQRADHFGAVLGAAGLDLQDHLDLVHVQPRGQPLVPDLEHVGTEIGQVSEELRERSGVIGQPAAERQVAARRR